MLPNSLDNAPRRFLQTVDLAQALGYIARCSLTLWKQEPRPQYQHTETIAGIIRLSKSYDTAHLAYVASEVIANSRGTEDFDINKFNQALDLFNALPVNTEGQSHSDFAAIQMFLSIGFPQIAIPSPTRLINRFGRYWFLYTGIPSRTHTGIANYMKHLPKPFNQLSIKEFFLSGTVILALAMWDKQGYIDVQRMTTIQLGDVRLTKQIIREIVEGIAIEPDEFRDKMNRTVSERFAEHTLVNPLLRHPIIKIDGRFVSPVVQLLIERCGQGLFEDFKQAPMNKGDREDFKKRWGLTFEKYIQYLLDQSNLSLKVWPEQEYDGLKTSDLIIQEGQNLIFIECKSSPMAKITKTFMDEQKYQQELRKITDGMDTIIRTAKHLREGKLALAGLDIGNVKGWAGCVITLDEYMLLPHPSYILERQSQTKQVIATSIIRDYFLRFYYGRLDEGRGDVSLQDFLQFPPNNLQVVSADDFEQLLGTLMWEKSSLFGFLANQTPKIKNAVHPELDRVFKEQVGTVRDAS